MAAPDDSKNAELKTALSRAHYWNNVWKKTSPPPVAQIGNLIAFVLPAVLYYVVLPAVPRAISSGGDTVAARFSYLAVLQVYPALVTFFYIILTGLQRIPYSPVAAHDPAAAYYTNAMPMNVIAGNRAFINTLEQYVLLLTTTAALVVLIPVSQISMIHAHYITWSMCRVVYGIGYIADGSKRMLGFPGAVLPTTAALVYAVYLAVVKGALL